MRSSTPFFQAFGPLLFGRRPGRKVKEVKAIESLGELYEVFGDLVPEKMLGLEPKGKNSRDRMLPPRVTFWAFVWQALNPASSCREVTRKIEAWWRWMQKDRSGVGLLSASAYCQARQRLESETLELILGHLHHTPLDRLSFKGALDTTRHFAAAIHVASATPRRQDDLIAEMLDAIACDPVPLRPGRSEPRARKRRPKNYQLLTKPRALMGNLPHRNRPRKNHPKPALS